MKVSVILLVALAAMQTVVGTKLGRSVLRGKTTVSKLLGEEVMQDRIDDRTREGVRQIHASFFSSLEIEKKISFLHFLSLPPSTHTHTHTPSETEIIAFFSPPLPFNRLSGSMITTWCFFRTE